MKITLHISFFYISERIKYINRIIDETNTYRYNTDIFIHTNKNISPGQFNDYKNGTLTIIVHDLSNINPYYLTWKCRDLLAQQKNEYDIFMYIEDDILVPGKALEYWLQYNEQLIEKNYNLGFVRIETSDGKEYITDLYAEKLNKMIDIDGVSYCVNDKNPYCAFWIYNKSEFNKFVASKYYDINTIGYGIRESSAVGLHGNHTKWYTNTVIPFIDDRLHNSCKIYHMPNNYINDGKFATIEFNSAYEQLT
jgi:hypothetical protein